MAAPAVVGRLAANAAAGRRLEPIAAMTTDQRTFSRRWRASSTAWNSVTEAFRYSSRSVAIAWSAALGGPPAEWQQAAAGAAAADQGCCAGPSVVGYGHGALLAVAG